MALTFHIKESERFVVERLRRILKRAGTVWEEETKRNIQANGLVDTGELLDSIKSNVTTEGNLELKFEGHGVFHELGTDTVPKRPFALPALDHTQNELKSGRISRQTP